MQTRRDFIDPFWKRQFGILIENGYAESYREVIHEDRVKWAERQSAWLFFQIIGRQTSLFSGGQNRAAKLKTKLLLIKFTGYGWSAKMPISVITDFEKEFTIYDCDCTTNPSLQTKASNGRKIPDVCWICKKSSILFGTHSAKERGMVFYQIYHKRQKQNPNRLSITNFCNRSDKWRVELALNIACAINT